MMSIAFSLFLSNMYSLEHTYRQISNISRTEFQF